MSASIQYRAEIDGLRSVAVLAVVAFHLGATWIRGGFVGVDVFFVISGFLITSIIARQRAEGTFRLRDFWVRRARRLLPVLGAVLALTTVGGYLILIGREFRFLGLQCVSVLTFWANLFMYLKAGNYWGPEAEDFSLLHCWSLSVEEQFYLLFPLAMVGLGQLGSRRAIWILVVLALASFGLAIFGARRYPAATFYLLPTRAWELLMGCLLALGNERLGGWITDRRVRAGLADLGGLMVLASFFLVRKGNWFPAPAGLLPTVGTALLIGMGRESGWAGRFLKLAPVVYLGRISYSWYLWHWPVIVLSRQAGFEPKEVQFAAGLGLAVASYHLLEVPTRALAESKVLGRIVLPVAAVGLLAFMVPRMGLRGASNHDAPTFWCEADLMPRKQPRPNQPGCVQAGLVIDPGVGVRRAVPIPGPVRAVLIGDSHAKSWLPVLDDVFGNLGWNYVAFPASGTSPFFVPPGGQLDLYGSPNFWPGDTRHELDRKRRTFLGTNSPAVVVVVARWFNHRTWKRDEFEAGMTEFLTMLPKSQFLFVGQPPELPFGDDGFYHSDNELARWSSRREIAGTRASRAQVHGWIKAYASRNSRVHFLETAEYFMDGGQVRLHEGRATLYRDDDHPSVEGVMRLRGVLREALVELAAKAPPAPATP